MNFQKQGQETGTFKSPLDEANANIDTIPNTLSPVNKQEKNYMVVDVGVTDKELDRKGDVSKTVKFAQAVDNSDDDITEDHVDKKLIQTKQQESQESLKFKNAS